MSILDVTTVGYSDGGVGEMGQDVHGIDHLILALVFVCCTLTCRNQQNMPDINSELQLVHLTSTQQVPYGVRLLKV